MGWRPCWPASVPKLPTAPVSTSREPVPSPTAIPSPTTLSVPGAPPSATAREPAGARRDQAQRGQLLGHDHDHLDPGHRDPLGAGQNGRIVGRQRQGGDDGRAPVVGERGENRIAAPRISGEVTRGQDRAGPVEHAGHAQSARVCVAREGVLQRLSLSGAQRDPDLVLLGQQGAERFEALPERLRCGRPGHSEPLRAFGHSLGVRNRQAPDSHASHQETQQEDRDQRHDQSADDQTAPEAHGASRPIRKLAASPTKKTLSSGIPSVRSHAATPEALPRAASTGARDLRRPRRPRRRRGRARRVLPARRAHRRPLRRPGQLGQYSRLGTTAHSRRHESLRHLRAARSPSG